VVNELGYLGNTDIETKNLLPFYFSEKE